MGKATVKMLRVCLGCPERFWVLPSNKKKLYHNDPCRKAAYYRAKQKRIRELEKQVQRAARQERRGVNIKAGYNQAQRLEALVTTAKRILQP